MFRLSALALLLVASLLPGQSQTALSVLKLNLGRAAIASRSLDALLSSSSPEVQTRWRKLQADPVWGRMRGSQLYWFISCGFDGDLTKTTKSTWFLKEETGKENATGADTWSVGVKAKQLAARIIICHTPEWRTLSFQSQLETNPETAIREELRLIWTLHWARFELPRALKLETESVQRVVTERTAAKTLERVSAFMAAWANLEKEEAALEGSIKRLKQAKREKEELVLEQEKLKKQLKQLKKEQDKGKVNWLGKD